MTDEKPSGSRAAGRAKAAETKAARAKAAATKPATTKAGANSAAKKPAIGEAPVSKRRRDAASSSVASTAPAASVAANPTTEPDGAGDGPIELYFLRHADAGDPLAWVGDDFERPLSKKGRRQAKRLGRLLDGVGAQMDLVLTSPRVRATETARLVARSIGTSWVADDRLGSDFGDEALRPLIAGLAAGASSVMLVGHDPDFSRAVSWLVGTSIEMRKGALARVSLPDRNVGAGRGSLRWLLPPDAVGR